jgi:maleate isomerase
MTKTHASTPAHRPTLGAVYPDDFWVDLDRTPLVDDMRSYLPEGVDMITSGTPVQARDATAALGVDLAENGDIEESARRLLRYHPDFIAYYCTTVSFIRGPGKETEIAERITRRTSLPATTTSASMIEALRHLGIKRVAVASPYLPEVETAFVRFIEAYGIAVVKSASLHLSEGHSIVDPDAMTRLAESVDSEKADAVFIGCTGQRLADHLEILEQRLDKPVMCANQVTAWNALRLMGIKTPVRGRGRLFGR